MNDRARAAKERLPLQKCMAGGDVGSLTEGELLAVVLGAGTRGMDVMGLSSVLLRRFGGLSGLSVSGLREIAGISGIGIRKAIRIHAAFEMGKRALANPRVIRHVDSPSAVWKILIPEMAGLQKEEFRVLIVNNKNNLLKKSVISVGTISEAIVHPREVFRDAIREAGSAIIISHNHPSGELTPSREDIQTTGRIAEAGRIIGIPLLDHVIITDSSYLSMKEEGYIT